MTQQNGSRKYLDTSSSPSQCRTLQITAHSDAALKARYLAIIRAGALDELRKLVLLSGMPRDANELGATPAAARCSLRGLVWKALLGIGPLDAEEYPTLVRKGPSADDHRVREDARRTFSKNDDFCMRVPNAKIIRLLNAYVHASGNKRGVYAQSMSLLAAPLLYVMPEPEAFHCFRMFLTVHVPLYVKQYTGARRGCRLLDRCLADVDPQLHKLFSDRHLQAEVYAFPSISSLGACVPPMSDTVRLWDIQLAFGAHMHIIFTLARLLLASPAICAASAESKAAPLITRQLEQGLGLDAETVLARAVPLAKQLDSSLYEELLDHAFRPGPNEASAHEFGSVFSQIAQLKDESDDAQSFGGSASSQSDDLQETAVSSEGRMLERDAEYASIRAVNLSSSNISHIDKCTVAPVTLNSDHDVSGAYP